MLCLFCLNFCSVLRGGEVVGGFEFSVEVGEVVETDAQGDIYDGVVGFDE